MTLSLPSAVGHNGVVEVFGDGSVRETRAELRRIAEPLKSFATTAAAFDPRSGRRCLIPFFTTKPAGDVAGLGLSSSHDIIVKGPYWSIRSSASTPRCELFYLAQRRSLANPGERPVKVMNLTGSDVAYRRNPRVQQKSAFARFPPVRRTNLEGKQRVESSIAGTTPRGHGDRNKHQRLFGRLFRLPARAPCLRAKRLRGRKVPRHPAPAGRAYPS
jgi:hypothetical protein